MIGVTATGFTTGGGRGSAEEAANADILTETALGFVASHVYVRYRTGTPPRMTGRPHPRDLRQSERVPGAAVGDQ